MRNRKEKGTGMDHQNYIVTEKCSEIRRQARKHLKGLWLQVSIGIALYIVMLGFIPELFNTVIPLGQYTQTLPNGQTVTISTVAQLYGMFMTGVFSVGLASFMLSICRHRDANPTHIFDGFEFYVRAFTLSVVKSIFIMLWTMLFIIPGIVAIYRYYMAEYILAEDPRKGAFQCIRESKQLMKFNKMKLFLLQLSFIGWSILASVPIVFCVWWLRPDPSSATYLIMEFFLLIPAYVLGAYNKVAETVFYEILTAPYRQQRTPPQTTDLSQWG